MQRVVRPITGAISAIRTKNTRLPLHRSPFSTTTTGPTPASAGHGHHHHYYCSKHDAPRRQWLWTIAAGALGYWAMSGSDSRHKNERRADQVLRNVEIRHRELKSDLSRIQMSFEQVRGQATVHRPSLQEILLREQVDAAGQRR